MVRFTTFLLFCLAFNSFSQSLETVQNVAFFEWYINDLNVKVKKKFLIKTYLPFFPSNSVDSSYLSLEVKNILALDSCFKFSPEVFLMNNNRLPELEIPTFNLIDKADVWDKLTYSTITKIERKRVFTLFGLNFLIEKVEEPESVFIIGFSRLLFLDEQHFLVRVVSQSSLFNGTNCIYFYKLNEGKWEKLQIVYCKIT